ncbi:MAG: phosphoribosylamine--glycine ligase [Pseudomonadota bacterium]
MRVLILGNGGREHALAWAIAQHPSCERLICAPGNPGMAALGERRSLDPCDPGAVLRCAREVAADLVVIGPEAPLAAGVSDALRDAGFLVFGPSRAAAMLETSKGFAKAVCDAAEAPTASWARFDALAPALEHLASVGAPIVVKADGLAAGKGVVVAQTPPEAEAALRAMFDGQFGAAGTTVILEEKLDGEEASLFVLADGADAVVLGSAQDHKRVGAGDTGPNTGGMGAYAPAPVITPEVTARAMDEIVRPCLAEMVRRGTPYSGVLYVGLMIAKGAVRLIEFNARFGDPETQVLALQAGPGLFDAVLAVARHSVAGWRPGWAARPAICVVMAARGYPGAYVKGDVIGGLAEAAALPGVTLFHAGTAQDGAVVRASGGRVLNICASADMLQDAASRAYMAVAAIDWPGGFVRHDIGWRALRQAP